MPGIEGVFHELAAKEYRAARRWYRKRSPTAADNFRNAIDEVVRRIAETPDRGVIFRGRFRWLRAWPFPYIAFFCEIMSETLATVYAVRTATASPATGFAERGDRPNPVHASQALDATRPVFPDALQQHSNVTASLS
jgi:plasmid stabilization system protein ParE